MLPTRIIRSRANTLGWIGLGAMGAPMATNLYTKSWALANGAKKGKELPELVFCEPSDKNAEKFVNNIKVKAGAEAAARVRRVTTPSDVSKNAARVFTMLPSTPQVESVFFDKGTGLLSGLAEAAKEGSLSDHIKANPWLAGESGTDASTTASTLFVDHTTLDPAAAKRIAKDVHDSTNKGALMLDAPVSGGVVGATAATLTIMFGSDDKAATEIAKPLMQLMARDGGVVDCGGSGTGIAVKVANNLVLSINQIALSEGLALGNAFGVRPELLHDIFNTSSAQSWSSRVNSPLKHVDNSPGSRDYQNGFMTKMILKDVNLALTAAHSVSQPTPLTWAAASVYEAVNKDESKQALDFSVVYQWLLDQREKGVEVGWKNGGPGDKA